MRLSATVAVQGLSTSELDAEEVIERMRCILGDLDPNAHVGIELLAVGTDFGTTIDYKPNLTTLLANSETLRKQLLSEYWKCRNARLLLKSLRLGHAMASMDAKQMQRALAAGK